MSNSVYPINKGINKQIEFRGLQAQYIWYFAASVLVLLILFGILHILGVNTYICLIFIIGSGIFITQKIYGWSHQYGAFGMMKMLAQKRCPKIIKVYNRRVFQFHKSIRHEH